MESDKLFDLATSVRNYKRSRRKSKVPSLNDRLDNAHGELHLLLDNINRIKRLSQILNKVLSSPLKDHCQALAWKNGTLTIAVDNNSWASRLRFEKTELMSHLRKNGFAGLTHIDIKLNPDKNRF
jgi:hypothetical protein